MPREQAEYEGRKCKQEFREAQQRREGREVLDAEAERDALQQALRPRPVLAAVLERIESTGSGLLKKRRDGWAQRPPISSGVPATIGIPRAGIEKELYQASAEVRAARIKRGPIDLELLRNPETVEAEERAEASEARAAEETMAAEPEARGPGTRRTPLRHGTARKANPLRANPRHEMLTPAWEGEMASREAIIEARDGGELKLCGELLAELKHSLNGSFDRTVTELGFSMADVEALTAAVKA